VIDVLRELCDYRERPGESPLTMSLSSRAKIAWCLCAPLLAAAYFELAIAAFDLAPPRSRPMTIWTGAMDSAMASDEGDYRFDPVRLWEPRPGALFVDEPINADGYRGPAYPRERSAALRIVALGESTTFGMHLSESDSWPRQLERRLRERGVDAEVLNFGVIGHTVAQGLATYVGRVREYRPDVVIACFGGLNEHFPSGGLDDATKLELFAEPGFRARMFFDRFGGFRWLAGRVQPPQAVPGAGLQRVSLAQYQQDFLRLRDETRRDGADLVLVAPPVSRSGRANRPEMADYLARLVLTCEGGAIPLARADLAVGAADDALPEAERSTKTPSKLFHDTFHPWPAGQALCAAAVDAALESNGAFARHRVAEHSQVGTR